MTQRNVQDEGNDGNGAGRDRNGESVSSYARDAGPRSRDDSRGRSRSHVHDDPSPQEPGQRTGSRHWMRDPEPPRMDFGPGPRRDELGAHGIWESHAGYGDYGTRDYDPRPDDGRADPEPDFRAGRRGGGEPPQATRPRDFRDYGRGDYRGNVGPGGFGYAESNYGPTRYGEAFGRSGREAGSDESRDVDRERRSFAGRGPRSYRRSDERIRETICERLTDDPHVDASDVTVEVKDGVVTLAGSVPDRRMKHRIEDIAADAARDRDVRNEVRVESP